MSPSSDDFDGLALAAMRDAALPGLAVATVADGRPVLVKSYGWADVERRIPVGPTTLFLLASPSKLIVAVVVFALVERGMIDLDEDVCGWVPFAVRHPTHPSIPITLRMLLGHRASLADDLQAMRGSYVVGDSALPLGDWLRMRLRSAEAFLPSSNAATARA